MERAISQFECRGVKWSTSVPDLKCPGSEGVSVVPSDARARITLLDGTVSSRDPREADTGGFTVLVIPVVHTVRSEASARLIIACPKVQIEAPIGEVRRVCTAAVEPKKIGVDHSGSESREITVHPLCPYANPVTTANL